MTKLPERLADLRILETAHKSAPDYYAPLLDSTDPVVQVGAWTSLIDRGEVRYEQYERLVELSSFGAIRSRAFNLLLSLWHYDLAERTIETNRDGHRRDLEGELMWAGLENDPAKQASIHKEFFLATGRLEAVSEWVKALEIAGGARNAIPAAVVAIQIRPHEPGTIHQLCTLLVTDRDIDGLEAFVELLERTRLHSYIAVLHRASVHLHRGRAAECLRTLATWSKMKPPGNLGQRFKAFALSLNGEALEKASNFRAAYKSYVDMNAVKEGKAFDANQYTAKVMEETQLDVPKLPKMDRPHHLMMLGFPRSGTTLLENVLSAHPDIETFEETSALNAMRRALWLLLPRAATEGDRIQAFVTARDKYFAEFDRTRVKPGAPITVDKMPIRSADAVFVTKIMPDMRYIFSIRHPFDVVLSCFKQNFKPNAAMENFRRFDTAIAFYDFALSRWFEAHSMEDAAVHYLRYDDLVMNFDQSVGAVLEFVGAPWDDSVRGFAEKAADRPARTPSYGKVRQGLSIGVQSSWRNYDFLFNTPEAKPLHKWAEFFGYPTS